MTSYDGLILAAGRNTRLKGVVPSYYKPLVLVNGQPLIISLVKRMWDYCEIIVIVVSPENAGPIIELLDANDLMTPKVHLVVQPVARGPGEGVYRALQACRSKRIILACGDNIISDRDFYNAVITDTDATANVVTVSVAEIELKEEAYRFTRISVEGDEFIENRDGGEPNEGDFYQCWVGPFLFDRATGFMLFSAAASRYEDGDKEIKISQEFNVVPDLKILAVRGNSVDVGTSDSLLENA